MKFSAYSKIFSLRFLLSFFIVFPVIIVLFSAGYFGIKTLESKVEKRMQEDLEIIGRTISPTLGRSMSKDRKNSVKYALESAFEFNRVYGVYVYDTDGKIITRAGTAKPKEKSKEIVKIAKEGDQHGEYEDVEGDAVYSFFVPLSDSGGKIIGLLQLTRQESDIRSYINKVRMLGFAGLSFIVVLITVIILLGYHKTIGKYINKLQRSMGIIENGNLGHRVSLNMPKEFSKLSHGLNSMLDSIMQSRKEISKKNKQKQVLEERLLESEKLAAMGKLATGIAHELGSPLSVINGKLRRLNKSENDEVKLKNIYDIRNATEKMESTIWGLLEIGKKTPVNSVACSAKTLVSETVRTVKSKMNNGDISVYFEIMESPSFYVMADSIKLKEAFSNILKNACQASKKGHIRISWYNNSDSYIAFCFEDDGEGINDEDRKRIFEPFYTTKINGEGVGLGLSLVKTIINEHKGIIDIADSDLGGTKFIVYIPEAEVSQNE